jgi:integrase
MAKKPHPWYREDRNGWFVLIEGKRYNLGDHPENAPAPKKSNKTGRWNSPPEIDEAFRKLLNGDSPSETVEGDAVVAILDDFIVWTKEHKASITAKRYEEFCQDFVRFRPQAGLQIGALPVSRLSRKHVTQWLSNKAWGPTTKRNALTAIQRSFNWAVKNRGLIQNPIRGMEKPKAKTRTAIIRSDEFNKLLTAIPDERFSDLLIVSYDSGARPFEIKDLERRHIQLEHNRAVIHADEAKGRKHTRAFYFPTERSMAIMRRLCELYPSGLLFRNRLGNKWTAQAVKCRFEDLDHILGRRVTHYSLRHAYITRKLVAGVDSHVVAKLSGHRDTKMLDSTYSHVADDYEFMLKEARKDVP